MIKWKNTPLLGFLSFIQEIGFFYLYDELSSFLLFSEEMMFYSFFFLLLSTNCFSGGFFSTFFLLRNDAFILFYLKKSHFYLIPKNKLHSTIFEEIFFLAFFWTNSDFYTFVLKNLGFSSFHKGNRLLFSIHLSNSLSPIFSKQVKFFIYFFNKIIFSIF